jgi:hypothetical protein
MTQQLLQVATDANLSHLEGGDDPFQMESAVVFAFTNDGQFRVLTSAPDVYECLEVVADKNLNQWEHGIGVITTGWAAPLGSNGQPEGAPSEHPLRRRVRLVSCVNKAKKMASSIRFADEPDDLVTDEGEATGSLAQALVNALTFMVAREN